MFNERNFCQTGKIETIAGVVIGLIVIGIVLFLAFDPVASSSLVGTTYDYTAPAPSLVDVIKDLLPLFGAMAIGAIIMEAIHFFRNRG